MDCLDDADVREGDHCWALSNGELLVVLKDRSGRYQVCGSWECGMGPHELTILSIIPRPLGKENTPLYYL